MGTRAWRAIGGRRRTLDVAVCRRRCQSATLDGAELGKAIAANPSDFETALKVYEKELFPRSANVAEEAARNLELFFDDTAPQSVVDLFKHL